MRIRACGVVIREGLILMVRHVHDGRDYWTLPGGGIDPNETRHAAAEREVFEETGIEVDAIRVLFSYKTTTSISHCVLMTSPPETMEAVLGIDPEESHLVEEQRMLREVAWHEIAEMLHNPMVAQVAEELGKGKK